MLPQLRELERRIGPELVVIGVHSAKFRAEKATEALRDAVLRYGIDHPVVNDRDLSVWGAYAVRAWPTLMFVDPAGRVFARHEGEASIDALERAVREMLDDFRARGLIDTSAPLPVRPELAAGSSPLAFPGKVAADAARGRLAVADTNHDRVLVVAAGSGAVERVLAGLERPQGLAFAGDRLWIAETGAHAVAVADLGSGKLTRVAGTGAPAMSAADVAAGALRSPWDVAVLDGVVYVAMAGTHQVWRLDPLEAFAGSGREGLRDGPLAEAWLAQPSGLAAGAAGSGVLWVADSEVSAVRRIDVRLGTVETAVGVDLFEFGDVDGTAGEVRLQHPLGVAWWESPDGGRVLIADSYNSKLKVLDPARRTVATLAGDHHEFNEPAGVAVIGNRAFVADTNHHRVAVLDLLAGSVSTLNLS